MSYTTKEDRYVQTFMGSDYTIESPRTVGELKKSLEYILNDLPVENDLEIAEFYCKGNTIYYVLSEGIML